MLGREIHADYIFSIYLILCQVYDRNHTHIYAQTHIYFFLNSEASRVSKYGECFTES